MLTERFLMGRSREALTGEELALLEGAAAEKITLGARQVLVTRGQLIDRSYFLVSGYMLRYVDDQQGHRQLVGISVPGDFVDLHAFPMKRLDHDIATLTTCELAVFPHKNLTALIEERPHLARLLWFSTLLDAAMHRQWIFILGRLSAEGRIAHMICELLARLDFVGLNPGDRFPIPLNQQDFAEACGITAVHTNRTFRRLRELGIIHTSEGGKKIEILDREQLAAIGEFTPDYLYGEGALHVRGELAEV